MLLNGVGVSSVSTAKLLLHAGVTNLILVDINGPVNLDDRNYNKYQRQVASKSSIKTKFKSLDDAIINQDVFIELSDAKVPSEKQVTSMANDAIVFALANPIPKLIL